MSANANEPVLPQGAGYGVGEPESTEAIAVILTRCLLSSCRYVLAFREHTAAPSSRHTGIGLFFSAFMIVLTAIQARYTGFSPKTSEEFNSASRSVKPGLIASGIVSAWTWAATLVRRYLRLLWPNSDSSG